MILLSFRITISAASLSKYYVNLLVNSAEGILIFTFSVVFREVDLQNVPTPVYPQGKWTAPLQILVG